MQTTLAQFNENQTEDLFALQNVSMLRVSLSAGAVRVRPGAVVAAQGEVTWEAPDGAGAGAFLAAEGTGELFLGERARNVHLVYLEDESIAAGGEHVLAFEAKLAHEVDGGVPAHVRLSGTGWVALLSDGTPVLLDVSKHGTVAAGRAAIAWSQSARAEVASGAWPGAADGGAPVAFEGHGWVLVQPAAR